jgi:hypothetical protein
VSPWPLLIVIDSPRFYLLSSIVERHKDIRVQRLIANRPLKLSITASRGFAGLDEVPL